MIRLATLFLAALLALPALATTEEAPGVLISRVSLDLLATLQKNGTPKGKREIMTLVDEKVLPHFDFARMTMLATGVGWRSASEAQRGQLVEQFRTLLVRTYSTALTKYTNQTLDFMPERKSEDGKKAMVRSLLKQPGAPTLTIDYRLATTAGGWKIYDVAVDGVSLVTTYRDSFAQEVRTGGIDGLVKMLTTKNSQLAAQDA
ncbi:MAG: phospholipid-binding protein MlaC [Gammaproteobacteria bacterium]